MRNFFKLVPLNFPVKNLKSKVDNKSKKLNG